MRSCSSIGKCFWGAQNNQHLKNESTTSLSNVLRSRDCAALQETLGRFRKCHRKGVSKREVQTLHSSTISPRVNLQTTKEKKSARLPLRGRSRGPAASRARSPRRGSPAAARAAPGKPPRPCPRATTAEADWKTLPRATMFTLVQTVSHNLFNGVRVYVDICEPGKTILL